MGLALHSDHSCHCMDLLALMPIFSYRKQLIP